eukprot:COSAG01_NODE_240_length_20656_cov_53.398259_14_plen_160_part_00
MHASDSQTTERNLALQQLDRYLGDLKADDLATKRSPRIAAQYVRAILAVCGANPKQLAAVIPHLMRVIHEYQLGQNKSIPVALKDISGGMGHWNTNPDVIFSSDYVAEVYTKQSKQLYNFLARQLDAPFRTALRPYLIDGSGQKTVLTGRGGRYSTSPS